MLTLHGVNVSPFVVRVALQLRWKGLDFTQVPPAMGTPAFLELNPIGKMPVLQHGDVCVAESAVVADYIEDVFPTPPMRGESPAEAARVRILPRILDLYVTHTFDLMRAARDPSIDKAPLVERMDKAMGWLEGWMDGSGGWAVGGRRSIADCALISWLFYGDLVRKMGAYDFTAGRPKLAAYHEFLAAQEEIRAIWADMDTGFKAFMARRAAEEQAAKAAGAAG